MLVTQHEWWSAKEGSRVFAAFLTGAPLSQGFGLRDPRTAYGPAEFQRLRGDAWSGRSEEPVPEAVAVPEAVPVPGARQEAAPGMPWWRAVATRLFGKGRPGFEDVRVVGGPLVLSTNAEVDAAEARLGIRFPSGYREYVTRLGDGVLGGSYVRIYPPRRVLSDLAEWRRRVDEHWFWEAGRDLLTKEQVLRSVLIGDTAEGDELVVHPNNPERVYVLPRDGDGRICLAGSGLPEAIEWLCASGTLTEAFEERNFEPFDSREGSD